METIDITQYNPVGPSTRSRSRFHILTGRKFGRLTVYSLFGQQGKHYLWLCRCECGKWTTATSSNLTGGHTNSCGCYLRDQTAKANRTHGESHKNRTPEYVAYKAAKKRCKDDPHYSERGIQFRFTSFEQFLDVLGRRPTPQHSLDRIDNDGHYERGNVRWATSSQQNTNKRSNKWLFIRGIFKPLSRWADESPVSRQTIWRRVKEHWCDECAVTLPSYSVCTHKSTTPDVMIDKVREYLK